MGAPPEFGPPSGERITVFVPGYQGTFLREQDHSLAWISPGAALREGDRSLALPFEGQREGPRFGPLSVEGPVTSLRVIPALFEVELYSPWLDFAKRRLGGVVPFGYDWRRDIRDSAADLCALIGSFPPSARVAIVAHSMGGLVSLQCLRRGPPEVVARVDKVVFVGTPFHGAPGIYDDLQIGTRIGRNRVLLDAAALFTFASAFELAPARADFFVDPQDHPVKVDAFSADAWVTQGWGLFADPSLRADPSYRSQLERMLLAHEALWTSLGDQDGAVPYQVMAVIGTGRDTVVAQRVHPDGSFDFEHPAHADGDGSVLSASAVPPAPIRALRVRTRAPHVTLLNDWGVEEEIARFLLDRPRSR